VDVSAFHGRVGDLVRVLASDAIEVVEVTVTARKRPRRGARDRRRGRRIMTCGVYPCIDGARRNATKLEVTRKIAPARKLP